MSHLGKRLSALVDGELSGSRRERALAHLARCEPCREEAVTLRMLKQRMRSMGEAAADDALTSRLIALAAGQGQRSLMRWPLPGRCRVQRTRRAGRLRLIPALVGAAVALVACALPAAAFLLGGGGTPPGPKVTPAVDVFMVQHSITGGAGSGQPFDGPSLPAGGVLGPAQGAARDGSAGSGAADSVAPALRNALRHAAPAASATASAPSAPPAAARARKAPTPALTPSIP